MEIAKREESQIVQADAGSIMAVISRAASDPNTDVVKLEKMLEMYERIMDRNAKVAYTTAFASMQAKLPIITEKGKIVVNGQVRSTYARFEDINEVCKPILQEHGFAVSFRTKTGPEGITVTGVLTHKDGHQEETDMMLKADTSGAKNDVQSIGSSVSYAKRYVMEALLNITSRGQDDDGTKGGGMPAKQRADFEAAIEALVDRPSGEKLWKTIVKVCNETKDKVAYDELKAKITAKMEGFRVKK